MAAAALAALVTGALYDRAGPRTLLVLPPLVAAVQGAGALGGGAVVGALYGVSLPAVAVAVAAAQVLALVLLVPVLRRPSPGARR